VASPVQSARGETEDSHQDRGESIERALAGRLGCLAATTGAQALERDGGKRRWREEGAEEDGTAGVKGPRANLHRFRLKCLPKIGRHTA
jgi:hypothetical protein